MDNSTFRHKWLWLLVGAAMHSSCFDGPIMFSQTGNSALLNRDTIEAPKSDADGVVTAKFDATSDKTQLVSVSSSSTIQSSSLAIPPGALAVDTDITMEEGGSLASHSTTSELGLAGNSFNQSGAAVVIESSIAMDTASPMTISIPLPSSSSLNLTSPDWTNLVVLYRVVSIADNGANKSGVMTAASLTVNQDGTVSFPISHFGIFQAVVTAKKVEAAVEVITEKPILSKRSEARIPLAVWSSIGQKFAADTRKMTLSASVSEVSSVHDCAIHLDDDRAPPFLAVKPTGEAPVFDYQAPSQEAEKFSARFECADNFARQTISDWVEVTIPVGDKEPPGSFKILTPSTVIAGLPIVISWEAAKDAVSYSLAIAAAKDCAQPIYKVAALTATSHPLPATLAAGSTWFACVSAADKFGNVGSASNNGLGFTLAPPPPETTISMAPPAISNGKTAEFAFSCNGTCTFEYRLNNDAAWIPAAATLAIAGMEGNNTLEVRAVSQSGSRDASPAVHTWVIDSVPPQIYSLSITQQVPPGPHAVIANSSQIFFVWGPANDSGSGISGYDLEYFADTDCSGAGTSVTGIKNSYYAFNGAVDGATYSFRVLSRDNAGNQSTSACSPSTVVDLTAPVITMPAVYAAPNSPYASFSLTATDTRTVELEIRLECSLDNGTFSPCSSPISYTGLTSGTHLFQARAVDTANNVSSVVQHSWTIDMTAPLITQIAVPSGTYLQGSMVQIAVSFSEVVHVTGNPSLALTIGGLWQTADYFSGSGTQTLTFQYTIRSGDSGPVSIPANQMGVYGAAILDSYNNNAILDYSIQDFAGAIVDATAPQVNSVEVPFSGTFKAGNTITFTLNFSEAVQVIGQPKLGIVVGTSTVAANYVGGSNSAALTFTYTVVAGEYDNDGLEMNPSLDFSSGEVKDLQGNLASPGIQVPALTNFLIDTIPPSPADGLFIRAQGSGGSIHSTYLNTGNFELVWTAAAGAASYEVFEYQTNDCTGTFSFTGSIPAGYAVQQISRGDGIYSFKVKSYDAVGNYNLSPCSSPTTIDTVPPQPASSLAANLDANGITLTWASGSDAGSGLDSQRIHVFQSNNAGEGCLTNSTEYPATGTNSFLITNPAQGQVYTFKIETIDRAGYATHSGCSPELTIPPTGLAQLTISGPANFGEVYFGRTKTQSFTVTNIGGTVATNLSITTQNPQEWSGQGGTCSVSLNPGSSCTVDFSYHPTPVGNPVTPVNHYNTQALNYMSGSDATPLNSTINLNGTAIFCPGAKRYWSISRLGAVPWQPGHVKMYEELNDAIAAIESQIDTNLLYQTFDFGSAKRCIKKIEAYTDTADVGQVLVKSSDDNSTWTSVWSFDMTAANQWTSSTIYMGVAGQSSCQAGYVLVPGLEEFGTANASSEAFCVAKYEMKLDGSQYVSGPVLTPAVNINRINAKAACNASGSQYHLLTNAEYMTIARNIEGTAKNWSGGTYGIGQLSIGHSDGEPSNLLAASADDDQACVDTIQSCSSTVFNTQRRTHTLANGEVIWDFAGNAAEWVDFLAGPYPPTDCSAGVWYEYNTSPACSVGSRHDLAPSLGFNSTQGTGKFLGGGSAGDYVRGGTYSLGQNAGIYSLAPAPGAQSAQVGFRCAYSLPVVLP